MTRTTSHRASRFVAMLVAILVVAPPAAAYFELVDTSSRALSFGDAYVALANDVAAVAWNPGGLGELRRFELHASASRPYFVPGLVASAILIGGPGGGGGYGAGWHRIGNEFASENLWWFSYGRWVYRDDFGSLHLGAALKIGRVDVSPADSRRYDAQHVVTGDLGALYRLRTRWTFGAVLRNLGEPAIDFVAGGGHTILDSQLDAGAAFAWRPESTISAGWTTAPRRRDAFRVGGEIWFYDAFAVRAGVLGTEFSGGFGLKAPRWQLDSAFVTHAQLGLSGRLTLVLPLGGPN